MSDNRTDLPSPSAPNFNQRLRETIQTYLGRQGNPLDRGLTLRDLIESGIVKLRDGFTLRPGQPTVPIEPGPGVVDTYEPDLTPPPTPSGFTATAAISNIIVEHDAPLYTQGHGHLRTRLYGKIVNTGDPLPTFADAAEIAQFSGTVHAQPTNPATTWRLWIKWETVDGVLSADPAGGTNGLAVTTGQDVSKLVLAMTGPGNPFKVVTEQLTLPDGTVVPTGTYTADAFIHNGQITNAKIANLAVDSAKIASVSADKITAGSIAVGQHIQSAGYVAGSAGWRINGDGNAELSNATVRGTVYATNGQFWGTLLGGAASSYSSGLGFYAGGGTTADGTNYRWRVGSPTGARIQWNGSAVEVYNSSNQLALSSGGITASQVSGLGALATQSSVNWNTQITNIPAFGNFAYLNSITSANISTYIDGAAIGTAYIADAAITQAKIGNLAVGSAQIADAAITTAKIGSAAVDTLQLAGQAVTIPVSAYTSGNITITGSTETTVQSVSLTSTGAPIFLLFTANIRNGNGLVEAGDSYYYNPVPTEIRIYRGATQIQRTSFSESGAMAVTIKDTAGAGNVTYYAKAYSIGGTQADGSSNAVVSARSLFLLETKR